MTVLEKTKSWGRLWANEHSVVDPAFLDEAQAALSEPGLILGFGAGRSYGDVCLNGGGRVLRTQFLDRLIAADWSTGVVRAEAGLTGSIFLLKLAVPRGWFIPVLPGTGSVTLGGAVANDVHGKNHETAGTFGCHVRRRGLARSDGTVMELGLDQNAELFAATIGGLGLTGIILWVELSLVRATSAWIDVETLELTNLDAFFRLSEQSNDWDFKVAWVDCLAKSKVLGRGFFIRGRWHEGWDIEAAHTVPFGTIRRTVLASFPRSTAVIQQRVPRPALGDRLSNGTLRSLLLSTRRCRRLEQIVRAERLFSAPMRCSHTVCLGCSKAPTRPDGQIWTRFVLDRT